MQRSTYLVLTLSRSVKDCLFSSSVRSIGSTTDLSGIFPPIVTPFNIDESIAYDQLHHNIELWNKIPFKGYVVQGSNGEYTYLTNDERVELVKKVVTMLSKDKLIVAGAGCESTRDTVEMCEKMTAAGAQALLIVTPCFYKGLMSDSALIAHYQKVADSSPSPIILYSVPGNTGIDLPTEVVIELSSHPNIIGIKDSGGDIAKIGNLVYKTDSQNFQVLAGSASFLLASYVVGGVGGVLGLANVLGQECCDLEKLFREGKMEDAKALQHRLIGPNMAVTKKFGMPGLKRSMEWKGYYGGPCRSPIQPLTQQAGDVLRKTFQESHFL